MTYPLAEDRSTADTSGHVADTNLVHKAVNAMVHFSAAESHGAISLDDFSAQAGGTGTPTWTEGADGLLYASVTAGSGVKAQVQALSGSDWEYEVAVLYPSYLHGNYKMPGGILIGEGTENADCHAISFESVDSVWQIYVTLMTDYATWSANSANVAIGGIAPITFFRIEKSGSTYNFKYSTDGLFFSTLYTTSSLSFTPANVGVFVNPNGGGALGTVFKHFAKIS